MVRLCLIALLVAASVIWPHRVWADTCDDAVNGANWPEAAVYCEQDYEQFMAESRQDTGSEYYMDLSLAGICLGQAGEANLHFDADTGLSQLRNAIRILNEPANAPEASALVRSTSAEWETIFESDAANYQPDDQ